MATKYTLTTAFTAITETSGTIQNVGNESVELASSTNAVAGEGIVLNPGEKRSFKGALSARSIGDAGAEVNVVDFIEAGEGGEEYILPIASDTELGGIKISNSFTVASDGTLNIKKSGKTILGAVKSSDDEGKVTVNNDGTMTYNPLGYRQPSTTYAVGNIAYHSALPTGWYLECTTAGISGSGDLTISSPSIGGTVTDGTVTWTVCKDLSVNGGTMRGNLVITSPGKVVSNDDVNLLTLQGGINTGGTIQLFGKDNSQSGEVHIYAIKNLSQNDYARLILKPGGELVFSKKLSDGYGVADYDLGGSAIVAKSLGTNGYIKYASGLIMQWGMISPTAANTVVNVSLPISFASSVSYVATACMWSDSPTSMAIGNKDLSGFDIYSSANTTWQRMWFAIGY